MTDLRLADPRQATQERVLHDVDVNG